MNGVRVRYAPSPTGHLHIGGARTALFNYLFAKHHGGTFILRIEDTDLERNVDRAADGFAEQLRWLGVEWDEGAYVGGEYGPYVCTERLSIYDDYIRQLRELGYAYDCFCTEDELAIERENALAKGETPRYSGRCRHLTEEQRNHFLAEGRKATVRFRVREEDTIHFSDMIRGEMTFEAGATGGDFVIVKSNGIPTYNFACTIDDHLMEITHVIRGEEHISNTPRQLLLYKAFGWEPPIFAHVSLILGADGKKLSKRDESIVQFIEQYRDLGYLPEAMFNFLALLGWTPEGEQEILTKKELISSFRLERVNKSGAFFDATKLAWMNGHYLRQRSEEELLPLVKRVFLKYSKETKEMESDLWLLKLIALYKDKLSYLAQLPEMAEPFLVEIPSVHKEAQVLLADRTVSEVLQAFSDVVASASTWDTDVVKAALKTVQATTGRKGKDLFMPIRAAILGQLHGPDLNQSLALLGRERILQRLHQVTR